MYSNGIVVASYTHSGAKRVLLVVIAPQPASFLQNDNAISFTCLYFNVGNVQEVLLRALRKRVQLQAEIPKRKCCRVYINRCQICRKRFEVGKEDECVGCDSCPRWYHKKCAGNPNMKKKWQCKQC